MACFSNFDRYGMIKIGKAPNERKMKGGVNPFGSTQKGDEVNQPLRLSF